jgi:tetratricopeptide (TPR) repeat protein
MPNEIKTAERIMETDPDSALHILQHMHTEKLMMSSSDRALYGLLLFQALDKNNKPLKPDSVINYSVNYYLSVNDKPHLVVGYFYKARIYKQAQRFDDATLLYLKALDLNQNNKDYSLLGKLYSDMGDICLIQKDFIEALKKYKLSSDCFNHAGKITEANYSILNIGRTYRLIKDYKAALIYYRKAIVKPSDSIFYGVAIQEIGINYYFAKQYDSAQYYLKKSLSFPFENTNYSIRCFTLADMFFDIQKYDSAYQYASLALKYPANFFTQRECYRILANTEYLKGNFKEMANFMTHFQLCSDSVRKIESQTKIAVLEDLHQTSVSATKTKRYLNVLGWILPLIVLISIYVFQLLRKHNKGKEIELKEVEQKLNNNETLLSQKQTLLIQKQTLLRSGLIQKIEESKSLQASIYKKSAPSQRDILDKELYIHCLHLDDWNNFSALMNHTFNNLINALEFKYPDITHKEIIWCCLFLLEIPTQHVLLLLEYKQDSLYKLKQRLVQKMNLKNAVELDNTIKQISDSL